MQDPRSPPTGLIDVVQRTHPITMFLRPHLLKKDQRGIGTHLSLTGGRYDLSNPTVFDEFQKTVADYLRNVPDGILPAITENHTIVFPMYFDLDGAFPRRVLTLAAVERIAATISTSVLRFYPGDSPPPARCIVLMKNGDADLKPGTTLYKHGIHVHFPEILVTVDQALQIRAGVVQGLTTIDWTSLLGIDPLDGWNDVVDESVYRGGLRMIGAAKAKKCPERCEEGDGSCDVCHARNNRHVVDPRVYLPRMALVNHERSDEYEREIMKNTTYLVKSCSVRSIETVPTGGYVVPSGCPVVAHGSGSSRKRPAGDGGGRVHSDRARRTEKAFNIPIERPSQLQALKKLFLRFSPLYEDCRVTAARRPKGVIHAYLHGPHDKYCVNRGGHHRSNRVYLEVTERQFSMRCWCPCRGTERNAGHIECRDMGRKFTHPLDKADRDVLFVVDPQLPRRDAPAFLTSRLLINSSKEAIDEQLAMFAR
jgi:hypothetical protein